MSSVHITLEPSKDGTIRIPVPPELRESKKLRVLAWIESESEEQPRKKTSPAAWARHARGIATPLPGESRRHARLAALQRKFGTR